MQQNNLTPLFREASILVDKDGFSFCTPFIHHKFSFDKSPTKEDVRTWFQYHSLAPQKLSIVYFDPPAVTVPQAIFDSAFIEDYYKTAAHIDTSSHTWKTTPIGDQHQIVYPVQKGLHDHFASLFPQAIFLHGTGSLLPLLEEYVRGKARKHLFIHLRDNAFELFLFQGSQLLLQNSFPQRNTDEFLYYLFYVTEQFYLQPEHFDLLFLGKYKRFENHYSAVEKFHPTIAYLGPLLPELDAQLSIPFFQRLIQP